MTRRTDVAIHRSSGFPDSIRFANRFGKPPSRGRKGRVHPGRRDSPHGKPHGKDQEMVGDRAEEDLIALPLHPN